MLIPIRRTEISLEKGIMMQYRDFKDLKLSALGMGCMRLPVKNGCYGEVDQDETQKMVSYAVAHGVNYFDTAYGYHDGHSEAALGQALRSYPRGSYYLADKFPGYDLSNMDKVESIFGEQLRRCGVDYFDFYLFHNVYEKNIGPYLDEKYGILSYLLKQKAAGRIRHLGFSCHGSLEVLKRFLAAYGDQMEFCQIQLNYLDWNFQDAKEKVGLLNERGLPIWVMEPLRGGRLAKLPEESEAALRLLRPEETVPAWAFRFLQTVPGVAVTLSGMSDASQMAANVETFESDRPLNEKEFGTLVDIADRMVKKGVLPCTGCRYCTSHCPQELNIPYLLSLYNEHTFTGGGFLAPMAVGALPEEKRPDSCLGCRSCEAVCPQQIKISEAMADFSKKLAGRIS